MTRSVRQQQQQRRRQRRKQQKRKRRQQAVQTAAAAVAVAVVYFAVVAECIAVESVAIVPVVWGTAAALPLAKGCMSSDLLLLLAE